ncbi:hypothetical protein SLEP1_g49198 [Rubroshorea leprosula]|uniref:Methyltransferase type 11 domain-containing protein n=1 Tax=Rubroshorea leprosula TaxID=152421 RepID=A0AAV5LWX1_9ROSI|nr:hypothetical protein SLEP1_g49198 [Rubroshorea leprosula]
MANLFINHNQAKQYAESRPSYPDQLFQFISSMTPSHDFAWDVATGSGQAARSLAEIYKNVVATDTSPTQLENAPKLPNIRYQHTPPIMSTAELEQKVAAESSVDLVTVAQALHWFDLPKFYQQVKWVLKKPYGVFAAWCYTMPEVNDAVDDLIRRFYENPYRDPRRRMVDDKYSSVDFPFEAVERAGGTGPFEFVTERVMGYDEYMTYLRSLSMYQKAKDNGVELLTADVVEDFRRAWNVDCGNGQKLVKFPVFLRIGKVEK